MMSALGLLIGLQLLRGRRRAPARAPPLLPWGSLHGVDLLRCFGVVKRLGCRRKEQRGREDERRREGKEEGS